MANAETWDSYEPTLLILLDNLTIKKVLEFGSGKSTKTISSHPKVEFMDSVEHDPVWADKTRGVSEKVNLIYEPDKMVYPLVQGRFGKYDLIFVDGIERPRCLQTAQDLLNKEGVVLLHDAQRAIYLQSIVAYRNAIFTDNGCTVVLTMNDDVHKKLEGLLHESRHTPA